MSTSRLPDAAELRRLYMEENLSMPAIALMFGVTRQRVHQRFQKAGIKRRPKIAFDVATLKKVYVRDRLTLQQVAERMGVSVSTIRKLRRCEIPIRERQLLRFERDLIYKLYVTDGMLMREIGDKLGCSATMICLEIKRHGIKERHSTAARRKRPYDRDQLHSLYIEQQLHVRQVAEILGGYPDNVRYWLKRYGIHLRPGRRVVKGPDLTSCTFLRARSFAGRG